MRALVEGVADPATLLVTKPLIAHGIRRAIRGLLRQIVRSLWGVFRNGHAAMSLPGSAATNGSCYDSLSACAPASMVAHVHALIPEPVESPAANGVLSMLPSPRFALTLCACAGCAAVPANPNQCTDKDVPMTAFNPTHPSHSCARNGAAFRRAPVAPARSVSQSKACASRVCGGRAS